MAGQSDGSAIKALFSPIKGDPPHPGEKEKQITYLKKCPSPWPKR